MRRLPLRVGWLGFLVLAACPSTASQGHDPLPGADLGEACAADADCSDGHCVDGICCESPCTGSCRFCAASGRCVLAPAGADPDRECGLCSTCDGWGGCVFVTPGADPKGECAAAPGAPCGVSGEGCDGAGACALTTGGTACRPATCDLGDRATVAYACDGAGTCVEAGTESCAPYACAAGPEGAACVLDCDFFDAAVGRQSFGCAAETYCTDDAGECAAAGGSVTTPPCCVPHRCGDGATSGAEECDDGNGVDTDACTNGCELSSPTVSPALSVSVGERPLGAGAGIDFGRVAPLLRETETLTLTNSGLATLSISGIQIAGDQYIDFEIDTPPATPTLAPAQSTTLVLRFRPRDTVIPMDPAAWYRTARVTFTTNDPAGPLTLLLSGTVGFVDCRTGDNTTDHRRCSLCLLDVTRSVERYVDAYVRPFVSDPGDQLTAVTTIRNRMHSGSPLFLFGRPPDQVPWRIEAGEQVIPPLLNRLAVVASSASLNNLQSAQLLAAAQADPTAAAMLNGINTRAARFSLPAIEMREIVALFGDYDVSAPEYEKFAFTASDIIRYRLADGCTTYARAFIALVKAMGIFSLPEEVRYLATARAADYSSVCSVGADNGTSIISGHQVVLVRIADRWRLVNTASGEAVRTLAVGFDPLDYLSPAAPFSNEMILFDAEVPAVPHLYRKIGANWATGICDNARDNLMNVYTSGTYRSPICQWPDYP